MRGRRATTKTTTTTATTEGPKDPRRRRRRTRRKEHDGGSGNRPTRKDEDVTTTTTTTTTRKDNDDDRMLMTTEEDEATNGTTTRPTQTYCVDLEPVLRPSKGAQRIIASEPILKRIKKQCRDLHMTAGRISQVQIVQKRRDLQTPPSTERGANRRRCKLEETTKGIVPGRGARRTAVAGKDRHEMP